jgi:hypothetical protein
VLRRLDVDGCVKCRVSRGRSVWCRHNRNCRR